MEPTARPRAMTRTTLLMLLHLCLVCEHVHGQGDGPTLMDALVELAPAPDWRPVQVTVDGEEKELEISSDSPFAAYIFKSISDPFAGHITLMRVFSGGVATDANVSNSTRDSAERLSALSIPLGKDLEHVAELAAGDIGALPKLRTPTQATHCAQPSRTSNSPR